MESENIQAPESASEADVAVESPMTGSDESFADVPAGEQTPESVEQEVVSQGGAEDQQRTDGVDPEADLSPSAGNVPDVPTPDVNEDQVMASPQVVDVANPVQSQDSFWNGFFGAPKIPRVGN